MKVFIYVLSNKTSLFCLALLFPTTYLPIIRIILFIFRRVFYRQLTISSICKIMSLFSLVTLRSTWRFLLFWVFCISRNIIAIHNKSQLLHHPLILSLLYCTILLCIYIYPLQMFLRKSSLLTIYPGFCEYHHSSLYI